jgi:exopolysaccharide biosynthesis protein
MIASWITTLLLTNPIPAHHSVREVSIGKCDVIQIDLSDTRLRVAVVLAEGFPGTDEPFDSMLKGRPVVAAVNGAYFDKYSKKPIGDIWAQGQLLNSGRMGTALCVTSDNRIDIRRVERHRRVDWSEFDTVLACGPALALDGKIDCNYSEEGFRDPSVTGRAPRMGVGYTRNGKLLMVYCRPSVTFEQFAQIMLDLGCHEAMNLDAGASLAMWFQGRTIRQAGRRLTNLLVVERRL